MARHVRNTSNLDLIQQEASKIGCQVTREASKKFAVYLYELMKWNHKINLTGHKDKTDIIANLFIDSLAYHKILEQNSDGSVLDIGSGGGFPGLPLKIVEPNLSETLVEPNLKKVSFLHYMIGTLGLKNVKVEARRIEEMPGLAIFQNTYDFIFMKALRYEVCLPYVKPLLKARGTVVFSRSHKQERLPKKVTGFGEHNEIVYDLPFGFGERVLIVMKQTSG